MQKYDQPWLKRKRQRRKVLRAWVTALLLGVACIIGLPVLADACMSSLGVVRKLLSPRSAVVQKSQ